MILAFLIPSANRHIQYSDVLLISVSANFFSTATFSFIILEPLIVHQMHQAIPQKGVKKNKIIKFIPVCHIHANFNIALL